MPSPFPGMDPVLEHPGLFPGVHQGFVAGARATLNTLLPQHYVADIGLLPPTSLSSLILAVSADAPPDRDARSRG
jgi:hypothetical protein